MNALGSVVSVGFCQAERGLTLYVLWGLPMSFILVIYSSVLQSSVVAPETQLAELSFDQMMNANFSFMSTNFEHIQDVGKQSDKMLATYGKTLSSGKDNSEYFTRQKTLGENIREPDCNLNHQLDPCLLGFSQKTRKVLVEVNTNRRMYESVMKFLGRNVVEGRETFSALPYYVLVEMPKFYYILKTLESMKAAGIFYDFIQKVEADYERYWIRNVSLGMLTPATVALECSESSECVDLSDSVIAEDLVMFLYCAAICLVCVGVELLLLSGCPKLGTMLRHFHIRHSRKSANVNVNVEPQAVITTLE